MWGGAGGGGAPFDQGSPDTPVRVRVCVRARVCRQISLNKLNSVHHQHHHSTALTQGGFKAGAGSWKSGWGQELVVTKRYPPPPRAHALEGGGGRAPQGYSSQSQPLRPGAGVAPPVDCDPPISRLKCSPSRAVEGYRPGAFESCRAAEAKKCHKSRFLFPVFPVFQTKRSSPSPPCGTTAHPHFTDRKHGKR